MGQTDLDLEVRFASVKAEAGRKVTWGVLILGVGQPGTKQGADPEMEVRATLNLGGMDLSFFYRQWEPWTLK